MIDFLADVGVGAKTSAGEQMITLDRVVALADRHFCGDQADIADVMLRAGMVAPGEMDVEGRLDLDPALAPVADLGGMTLGVRGGEFAPLIAGAGDQAGADVGSLDGEAQLLDRGGGQRDIVVAYAGDQQVLPDREADLAVAEIAGDGRKSAHLVAGQFAERQRDADPVQPVLLLLVRADMGHAIEAPAAAPAPPAAHA